MSGVKKDRWVPVLRGTTYCSPACGYNCTIAMHAHAEREADRLVKRLRAKGWKPRVWENLGWHYCAELSTPTGKLSVYPSDDRTKRTTYFALLGRNPECTGGNADWDSNFHSTDPNRVVEEQMRTVRLYVNTLSRSLMDMEEAVAAR